MNLLEQAQQLLNVPATGIEDAATVQAAKDFQQAHGLGVDGIIGPLTLAALGLHQVVLPRASFQPTEDEVAQALASAFSALPSALASTGAPSASVLTLLMAQTSFETRDTTHGIPWNLPNYNMGGIKATQWDPFVQVFETTEGQGAQAVTLDLKFAAYQSLADGAEAYVRVLKSRSAWWQGLLSGTPQGLIAGLTTPPAYFTGDPASYLAGLRGLVAQYAGTAAKYAVE
jgi:peptidoglycan hydrolase-like protein with peptidoglycan-binding domain